MIARTRCSGRARAGFPAGSLVSSGQAGFLAALASVLASWLALSLAHGPAAADPLDEFGLGARAAGLAGAGVVTATGVDAAHDNPAGLARAENPALLLGYGYGLMSLSLSGRDAEVLDAHGLSLGLVIPAGLGGGLRAALGVGFYMPDQFLARVQQIPPTEPHFILLDNDPHRFVVDLVASVAIGEYLAIGGGASALGDVQGNEMSFNVGVVAGEKVGEAALDAELPLRLAPILGLQLTLPRLRLGAAYRAELAMDTALDILANVDVAGVVAGDALVSIRAHNYFTPQRLSVGIEVDPLADLTLSGKLEWLDYSAYESGVADLRVLITLDITPPLVSSSVPAPGFSDVVTARLGAEYRLGNERTRYAVRAGGAWVPTPVPEQIGLTSFADNDRLILATGLGITLVDWRPFLTRPVELAVGLQWHHLLHRLTVKDIAVLPGEAFSSGGDIVHLSTSMSVSF